MMKTSRHLYKFSELNSILNLVILELVPIQFVSSFHIIKLFGLIVFAMKFRPLAGFC